MAQVKIRSLPDSVVAALRTRAAKAGHSLEHEMRTILTGAVTRSRQEAVQEIVAFQAMLERKYNVLSDSTPGIRADRARRG
jgi:plasmid stability protein